MKTIRFELSDDLIDICLDNVFKAVFTRDTPESRGALSALLSAIIGRQLLVLALALNEPPIRDIHDRQIRFDINCKAHDGEFINVEMSLNPDTFELKRLEYHVGRLYSTQDIRGQDKTFDDLKATYQVAFLVNRSFFADKDFLHEFEYYDPKRKITLGGLTRIFTLELGKLEAVVKKPVAKMTAPERWTVFCRYLTDKTKRGKINQILEQEEGIAMAGEVLLTISKDEIERARLLSEYKYIVDTQSKVVQAKREGKKEGLAEGEVKGLVKGLAEGEVKGLVKGKKEGLAEGEVKGEAKKQAEILAFLNQGGTVEQGGGIYFFEICEQW
jgi:predicted transposase/invertase (TIGR01784 family)